MSMNKQQNTTNSVITPNTNTAGMQGNNANNMQGQGANAGAQANTTAGMQGANTTSMQGQSANAGAQANATAGMQGANATGMQGSNTGMQGNTRGGMQSGMNQSNAQAQKTVIGVFNSRSSAESAVNDLRQRGFTSEEINIVSKEGKQRSSELYDDDVTDGALTGSTLGGIGGLLLGAGALAIPGVGPIVAAGPIAAALSGAVAGGIAGGLIDWGIPAEASHRYEQSVAQGGILTAIQTNQEKVNMAAQILRQHGATDVETHNKKS